MAYSSLFRVVGLLLWLFSMARAAHAAPPSEPVVLTMKPNYLVSFGESYHFGAALLRGPHVSVYIDGLTHGDRVKRIAAIETELSKGAASDPNTAQARTELKNLKLADRAHAFFDEVGVGKQVTQTKPAVVLRASDSTRLVAEGFQTDPEYPGRVRAAFLGSGEVSPEIKAYASDALATLKPGEKPLLIWNRTQASGFGADVTIVEDLLVQSCLAARNADEEEAFALALALEGSEIDAIYTMLLQASPLARYPDFAATVRSESTGHHHMLRAEADRRCRSERTRLRIALLAAHEH